MFYIRLEMRVEQWKKTVNKWEGQREYYFDLEVASYVILHFVCIFGNEDCNF